MGRDKPVRLDSHRLLSILIALSWPVPAFAHGLEISAGVHTNLDGDHRQVFGNAGAISLGYGTPISPGDAHLIVEIGYLWNAGQAGQMDPTFETPETRYWIVPVLLGIRTDLLSSRYNGPARERLSIWAEAKYDTDQLNYTGATLQLGLSLGAP